MSSSGPSRDAAARDTAARASASPANGAPPAGQAAGRGADVGTTGSAKQRRRDRISDAATSLFLQRGFDAVSIAEIAEKAGVSKMTVTNHFPLKEDLVFDEFPDEVRAVGEAVSGAASLEETVDAVERYCERREGEGPATRALNEQYHPGAWAQFAGMVLGSRALTQRYHAHYTEIRDAIAAALPDDLPDRNAETAAWMIAETVHFVDWWQLEAVGRGIPAARIKTERVTMRERAFAMLRHGLSR